MNERRPRIQRTETGEPVDDRLRRALSGSDLGLQRGSVVVSAASPHWATAYRALESVLEETRPDSVRAIAHIGSTAVPGLAAKPILDVAIGTEQEAELETVHAWLAPLGFLFRGSADQVRPDDLYGLELEPGIRAVNAHVVEFGGTSWRRYLAFRDRLRGSDAERDAYARLKTRLASDNRDDRHGYLAGKAEFVVARRD